MMGMTIHGADGVPMITLHAETSWELMRLHDRFMREQTMQLELEVMYRADAYEAGGIDTE